MRTPEERARERQEFEDKIPEEFERLKRIADVLRDMGFHVSDRLITLKNFTDPTGEAGFPIVSDGADGIRAALLPWRGLDISFTNGFEEPNNPRRLEVVERLKKEGLI